MLLGQVVMAPVPDSRRNVHRIRPNHREWSPAQIIWLSATTTAREHEIGEFHVLTGWSAILDVRRARNPDETGTVDAWGELASELADQVSHWCAGQKSVWLYSYDLSFDLAVTRLPVLLKAIGWDVTSHALTSDSPWIRMRSGSCVITMSEARGWLRAPLSVIGADLHAEGNDTYPIDPETPTRYLSSAKNAHRMRAGMLQILQWWDTAGLGSWTLTASSAGWNAYRHMSPGPLPLIIAGDDEASHDRKAIYGGRREAFRWGDLDGGPWSLLDFKSAYPTIAATFPLPVQRMGSFTSMPADSPVINGEQYGIIAEVELETDVPRWPVRVGGRVAYPVGRFITTLAGPEIAEAHRLGCLIRIGPGRLHRLSWHMRDWALWILRAQDGGDDQVPIIARRLVKHWGRAVIGKTAAHGYQTRPLSTLGGDGWTVRQAWNAKLQAPSHLTDVCGTAAETIATGDGDNAYPAILAFVESWVRMYLSRAIESIPPESVISCDTDGIIASGVSPLTAGYVSSDTGPLEMRIKETYDQVRIIGPQHVITDVNRKLSGIPGNAAEKPDGRLEASLWPKLAWQMEHHLANQAPGYVRPKQTYTLPQSTITAWCMTDGTVLPLTAQLCRHGGTHLRATAHEDTAGALPDQQAVHLRLMLEPLPEQGQSCTHQSSRSNGMAGVSIPSRPTASSRSSRPTGHRREGKGRSWRSAGRRFVQWITRG